MNNVESKLFTILRNLVQEKGFTDEEILKKNLVEDLNVDSITVVSMIIELESEFGIEIDDKYLSLESLSSFDKIMDLLYKHGVHE